MTKLLPHLTWLTSYEHGRAHTEPVTATVFAFYCNQNIMGRYISVIKTEVSKCEK
jgi:hypothetical protein